MDNTIRPGMINLMDLARTKKSDAPAAPKRKRGPWTPEERVAGFRRIVANHTAEKLEGVRVDLFSASTWVAVYDRISDENKVKLAGMTVENSVALAMKLSRAR